ncbi:MAG: hypothetical protein QNL68_20285 [Akkermansiaceae bacterium]
MKTLTKSLFVILPLFIFCSCKNRNAKREELLQQECELVQWYFNDQQYLAEKDPIKCKRLLVSFVGQTFPNGERLTEAEFPFLFAELKDKFPSEFASSVQPDGEGSIDMMVFLPLMMKASRGE